ncbi:hypothetical protein [Bordetella genomosp. 9]|uniref:hypothetical protein n=1 Tax=Bordetella genomosp. 9 TaxID=1416803 RepID=UPI00268001F6
MNKVSPAVDRQVRIELLRARAAVERESLVHCVSDLTQSLSPSRLIKGMMPRVGVGNASMLAWRAFSMARRYPVIMSTVSAIFLRGKRSRLLKLATAAVVGFQVYRGWRARQEDGAPPAGSRGAEWGGPGGAENPAVTDPTAPISRPPSA